MNHTLADVSDLSRLQRLLESQYDATGVPTAIFDHDGAEIIGTRRGALCEEFFRSQPETMRHCRECEASIARRLAGGEPLVVAACENGLGGIGVPVTVDGRMVASMIQSGFLLEKPSPDTAAECAARYGFDREAYLRALEETPLLPPETPGARAAFLQALAGMVSDLAQKQAHGLEIDRELDRLEAALYASESRFRNYFNLPLVGIFIALPDGRLIDANDKCCSMLEHTRREMGTFTWDDITYPDDREANRRELARVVSGEIDGFTMDTRCLRRDSSVLSAILNVRGIRKVTGEVDYFLAVILDITRRKLAEAEIRKLNDDLERRVTERTLELESAYGELKKSAGEISDLYNNAPCGYHSLDANGLIVRMNDTELRWLGYSREEIVGKLRFQELFTPESREKFIKNFPGFKERGHVADLDFVLRRKDGSLFPVLVSATAISDSSGNYLMSRSTVFDITELKETENALRSSEEKYRVLFSNDVYAVSILEPETNRFLDVNDACAQMYGYSREELLDGMTLGDLVCDPGEMEGMLRDDPETPTFAIPLQQHRKESGEEFPVEIIGGRYTWKGARVIFMITRDITTRIRAEEALRRSEQRFRGIFNSVFQFIFLIEPNGIMTEMNRTAMDFFGPRGETGLGRPFWECAWWPSSSRARRAVRKAVTVAARGKATRYETAVTGADGREAAIDFSLKPVRDDGGSVVLLVAEGHEITERKRMENELRRRSEELSRANSDLAKAARLKDDFLASMSHELRTPLNAILGMSEALQEVVFGPLNERQRKSVRSIEESGRHLLSLINDILDLSKIEAGKMELQIEPVSVESLCQTSLRFVRELASKKRITISERIESTVTTVHGDERRLKQMLINLLGNAVKFTPEEGTIGLDAGMNPEGTMIRFAVWDTGIGIPPEDRPRLFEPFVQLDSSLSRQYPGTGLGLSLVQRIAELHGGKIEVESAPGTGSRFTILIPHIPEDAAPDPAPGGLVLPPPVTFRKALVIEDSPVSAEQLIRYLTEFGVEAVPHCQGRDAIERAKTIRPDIIFLAILLPDVPGWTVLRGLNADPATSDIPIVVISVVDDRQQGLSLGAADYLVKPVDRNRLFAAMGELSLRFPPGKQAALPDTSSGNDTPARILIVEDETSNAETLAEYFQVRGYRISLARDGEEAIAAARRDNPSVILMDIQMPGMNGIEATRRMHADPVLSSIPVVALTALAMEGDRERCIEAGAADYIAKPVRLNHLIQTVEKYLHPVAEETSNETGEHGSHR